MANIPWDTYMRGKSLVYEKGIQKFTKNVCLTKISTSIMAVKVEK